MKTKDLRDFDPDKAISISWEGSSGIQVPVKFISYKITPKKIHKLGLDFVVRVNVSHVSLIESETSCLNELLKTIEPIKDMFICELSLTETVGSKTSVNEYDILRIEDTPSYVNFVLTDKNSIELT